MNMIRLGFGLCLRVMAAMLAITSPAVARSFDAPGDDFFEAKVRPILVARCLECHGEAAKPKAGLRLTSRETLMLGGDSGAAAVPGDVARSLLVESIHYRDDPKMPPKGKLPDVEIATLERWVAMGLPWPKAANPAPLTRDAEFKITDDQRRFWSFQPVKSVEPPPIRLEDWPINPIDRFILAKLEKEGLTPAPDADRATLIRRVTFDLIGLPPTPGDVSTFVNDRADDAYTKVVDRLLGSSEYGQRWARHWLDVARYADSRDARGVGGSDDIADAWRYRDWVVSALNRDLPYDQFIIHQIAGDQVPGVEPDDINPEGMVATGLITIGEWGTGDADKEKMLTDVVADQIDVVTRGFLGLTVACARCHDHKFDPISTADYYALAGIFFSTKILPGPGDKTAGSPMLRTPLATKARLGALKAHAENLAQAEAALKSARDTNSEAMAKALVPRLREVIQASQGSAGPGDLPPFVVRKWAACLALADPGRVFQKRLTSVEGFKGVDFWSGDSDNPWIGVNATGSLAKISTLTLPPRSVNLHPGPKTAGAIRWRSPVEGEVRILGKLSDADPNGGNGVDWSVSIRNGVARRDLTTGVMDNGGTATIKAQVEVHPGDLVELAVGPRQEYSFDTTTISFEVETTGPDPARWDMTADLLPDLLANNPHPDRQGHANVWELVEIDPLKTPRPLSNHPAWLEWDRSDRSNEAAEVFARQVEADPNLRAAMLARGGPFRPDPSDEDALFPEVAQLKAEVARLKGQAPPPIPTALVALEGGVPRSAYEGFHDAKIQIRGDYRRLGPVVSRRVPEVVAGNHPPTIEAGSGRMELARWIASTDNPLTARVMVNRVWQGHFGSGLVRTPGNFGKLGEPPTHPELLDWLASQFMSDGWSLKHLHRLMVTSRTYRQVSTPPASTLKLDPDNRLWGRMERRRLEAEAVRDALLAASGKLDTKREGPSTRDFNSPRRTLYQMTIRSDRSSFGSLFDAADSTAMVERRVVSTVAPQALFLMNHPFVIDQAKALGARLESGSNPDESIKRAYLLLYSREPTVEEVAIARELIEHLTRVEGSASRAWQAYAQVLLCSNEFLYVD